MCKRSVAGEMSGLIPHYTSHRQVTQPLGAPARPLSPMVHRARHVARKHRNSEYDPQILLSVTLSQNVSHGDGTLRLPRLVHY